MTQPMRPPMWFVGLLLASAIALPVPCRAEEPAVAVPKAKPMWVSVGTYTGPKSKGIYLFHLDHTTGILTPAGVAGEVTNPSFLAIHPTHKFLYAVGEVDNFG